MEISLYFVQYLSVISSEKKSKDEPQIHRPVYDWNLWYLFLKYNDRVHTREVCHVIVDQRHIVDLQSFVWFSMVRRNCPTRRSRGTTMLQ